MNTESRGGGNTRFADSRLAHSRFAATQLAGGIPSRMVRTPTNDQKRALALALLIHGFLIAALAWGVNWRRDTPLSVEAELWASVPQEAARVATRPEPEPEPPQAAKPPPPPPPVAQSAEQRPSEADIVMERERQAREAREQAERERQARIERERKERERKAAEEKRKREELLAQKREQEAAELREKLRQEQLQRLRGMAVDATSKPVDAGQADVNKGPSNDYKGRIRNHIRRNIAADPNSIPGNPTAEIEVQAAPDGLITGHKLTKSSGNPIWDQAVRNAIIKAERLPLDETGKAPPVIVLELRPKE